MKRMKEEEGDNFIKYKAYTAKKCFTIIVLLALAFLLIIVGLYIGSSNISFIQTLQAFFRTGDKTNIIIVWNIRMPRILAAVVAGGGLAISGCIMQSVLKNPMASPSTLGVSNGAVFGANFAIIFLGAGAITGTQGVSVSIDNPYLTTICAFAGAVASIALIFALSAKNAFSNETVTIAGIALGAFFQAGTTILQYFAEDTQLSAAVFWTFGDLGRATYDEILIMTIVVVLSFLWFFLRRWDYNALSEGDETAKSLGVRVRVVRLTGLFLSSLICAVCVSFLGIIGFVGLIAPHAARRFVGNDQRFLLPASALGGSVLLLSANIISRCVVWGMALPIGAVTSFFGAPCFLWMLIRKRGQKRL